MQKSKAALPFATKFVFATHLFINSAPMLDKLQIYDMSGTKVPFRSLA